MVESHRLGWFCGQNQCFRRSFVNAQLLTERLRQRFESYASLKRLRCFSPAFPIWFALRSREINALYVRKQER